jgi:solute carrier family 25 phosphate transporter 23/24/25/41
MEGGGELSGGSLLPKSKRQAVRMAIGGIAGTVAKTSVAPLERVRIMAQTGHGAGSALGTVRLIVQREGVAGLWRGNLVNCIRVFPSRGILFSCNDLYKSLLAAALLPAQRQYGKTGKEEFPFWLSFSSGSLAGITACAGTYPLDVARTRMSGKIVQVDAVERSLTKTLATMLRTEGLRSWYRGVWPTLIGSIPYEGIKFSVFDAWCDLLLRVFDVDTSKNVPAKLLGGAIAGAAAGVTMFPNDTVRRLLQMQGQGGAKPKYRNAIDCWQQVYREEGVSRFFRGVVPYVVRMMPNSAIQFGTYGFLKEVLLSDE